ncbi:MAG: hypothetical protein AB1756_09350 [Acidobacteriota bacterium]
MELREPLNELVASPLDFVRKENFPRPEEIRIYDTTLRDGEQTPGVAFSPEQKYEIARMLSDIGVHIIDMGFPGAAASDRKALQMIMQGKERGEIREDLEILVMCRSNIKDIDVTMQALREIGIDPKKVTFFIFTSGSDLHLKYKIGKTLLKREGKDLTEWLDLPVSFYREANIKMACEAISYARGKGINSIEFGGEDGSRSNVNYMIDLAGACYEAGGTRYSFPDTVGIFTPEGVDYYIPKLVKAFPEKPLVVHFHNDFGLGAINTVRAISHGANVPTMTTNGMGERAGNAPLHQVMMILKELYGIVIPGFRYERLWELRNLVERHSGIPVSPCEPIIGENVFTHESGIHTAGLLIHKAIYQVIEPESVGGKLRFVFGKHSGAAAIEEILKRNEDELSKEGVKITPHLVNLLMNLVKDIREKKALISQHLEGILSYYSHLHQLGISEEDVLAYAIVLGRDQQLT